MNISSKKHKKKSGIHSIASIQSQNYRINTTLTNRVFTVFFIFVTLKLTSPHGTEEVALPCFTLQPLVENAIIHGIEPKEEGGYVRIRVRKRFGFVQIKIIDNGVGFPKDKLNDFLNMQKGRHEGHATAIGVSNVYSRLKYFTNDMKCLSIRSKSGVGTVITLNIPERKVESDYV